MLSILQKPLSESNFEKIRLANAWLLHDAALCKWQQNLKIEPCLTLTLKKPVLALYGTLVKKPDVILL